MRVGFLMGDVNQSRMVTVADLGLVNAVLRSPYRPNFLKDVNASGGLTVADEGLTNANLTRAAGAVTIRFAHFAAALKLALAELGGPDLASGPAAPPRSRRRA